MADGLATPPVGLVLVATTPRAGSDEPPSPGVRGPLLDAALARQLAPGDRSLVIGAHLAVVRAGLTAPAEAEGLAYRLHGALSSPVGAGPAVAIGVAVSRRGDDPADLVRYAEHALGDALVLGGDLVVVFDDGDRQLLQP